MTNRERAMNILHYKPVDRFPAVHFGYWSELLEEWADQGKIPRELAVDKCDGNEAERELDRLIGWDFNWYRTTSAKNGLFPQFEYKVLEVCHLEHSVFITEKASSSASSPVSPPFPRRMTIC